MNANLTISPMKKNELCETARLAALAFLTDPADHIKAVWQNIDENIVNKNHDLFKLLLNNSSKEVFVIKSGSDIVGVYGLHHSNNCHLSLWQQIKLIIPMLRAVGIHLPRLIQWHNQWGEIEPKKEHLHLSPMCVKVGSQGKGIGKTMLEHLCSQLDKRQLNGYLETGKLSNVAFYKKFGFKLRQEKKIYGANTWTMWREYQN